MSNLAEIFDEYKNVPIALYGLGTETEKVLAELNDKFNIVGLLDVFREDGTVYGKQIIPLSKCIEYQVELIIVVARPGSCRAIAKRIGNFCIENHIRLFDVRGKDLCIRSKTIYDFKNLNGVTKEQLLELTIENEVISIDLFDTLIMRKVLFSTDIIDLVDERLKEKGVVIEDFCTKRLQCEKELSKSVSPGLQEIYERVLDESESINMTAKELADLEWKTDFDLIIPRQEMVEFLSEAARQRKKVYIVTDTYYSREQIVEILNRCGIEKYADIYVSSEYKTGKTQNLFDELKRNTHKKKYLHIGDDLIADIECAKKRGITACQIYSGLDLLEMVGFLGLWEHADSLSSRIKMGMFVATVFNSPFQFETTERRICINDAFDLGYLLMGPMITDFVIWFTRKVKEENLKNVWFGARDGYLIKRLYDLLVKDNDSVYFLTSRIAAIRAGMINKKDVEYIANMKYSGNMQQQLKERFGIVIADEDVGNKSLTDFSSEIISNALSYKKNYQMYINRLKLFDTDIAFFDFVAKGTSQMYCSRLIHKRLKGLYFLQLEEEFAKAEELDIHAFYENDEVENSVIFEDYYIMETILTSPMPSVLGFDENGDVCFDRETRRREDIECFQKVQNGIIEYFKTFLQICPQDYIEIDKKIDEKFLGLIHQLKMLDNTFIALKVEDAFFNRMTDVADLI